MKKQINQQRGHARRLPIHTKPDVVQEATQTSPSPRETCNITYSTVRTIYQRNSSAYQSFLFCNDLVDFLEEEAT
jgi:hypothetical protein